MAEWLKALAWKACIRETVSWVRIPLPPPARSRNDAQVRSYGLSLVKITSVHQSSDLAIRDVALEHPEAAVRMDVFDPFGTEHFLGSFDCTRDLIRRLDFR